MTTASDQGGSPAVTNFVGEISRSQLIKLSAQLVLVVGIIWQYRIQNTAFEWLSALTLLGFVINACLPFRHRLRFFLLLSIVGIFLALGVLLGAIVLGCSALMIFACCVRFPLWGRILLVLTVAGPLAAVQAGWIHLPALHTVIPIIGSMFMFRIIIALYDLAHSRDEPSFTQVASYFLMLPNVCFPLFPVVDFKTFLKTYYNAPAADIYGKGVRWMMIGAVHILLYRLLSTYVSINPDQFHHIHGVVDKIRFVASDYLLYLHVSGRFHLAIGMLHLFGFNLPRTQNRYYLASSFTDLWRRINIYWTNFMQKLVYYPVATQCRRRKLSPIAGVIVASVAVVIATCLLHSYQTFWLTNLGFKMTLQDMIFWGTLGVLITGTSVYEFNHGRMRRLTASENRGINYWIKRSASTLTVFVIMCVLWSLWSSTSTRLWIDVLWSA